MNHNSNGQARCLSCRTHNEDNKDDVAAPEAGRTAGALIGMHACLVGYRDGGK